MLKSYYMLVTNDKYEFPLSIPMKAKKLAAMLGLKETSVRYYSTGVYQRKMAKTKRVNKKRNKHKIVRFIVDFDEEDNEC